MFTFTGAFDVVLNDDATSPGQYARYKKIAASKSWVVAGLLKSDILSTDHYISDKVNIGIKLFMANADTVLVQSGDGIGATFTPQKCKITITDCQLTVPRVKIKSTIKIPRSIHYNYVKHHLTSYLHPKQISTFGPLQFASGKLPSMVLVYVGSEERHTGSYKLNRLLMKPENVKNVLMTVNQTNLPNQFGFECDYAGSVYNDAYLNLFDVTKSKANIPYDAFDSYCMYAFDLTESKCGVTFDKKLQPQGVASLTVTFRTAPTTNMRIFVHQVTPSTYTLNDQGHFLSDESHQG